MPTNEKDRKKIAVKMQCDEKSEILKEKDPKVPSKRPHVSFSSTDETVADDKHDNQDDTDYHAELEEEDAEEQQGEEENEDDESEESEGEETDDDEDVQRGTGKEGRIDIKPGLVRALLASGKARPTPLHDSAKEGDAAGILDILENDEEHQVDETDMFGYTPLHVASEHGQIEVVRTLVEFISREKDVEKRRKIIDARSKFHDFTPAHSACFHGQLDVVKLLKMSGADFLARTDDKRTMLHLAAFRGYRDLVEYLITLDLDFNVKDSDGDWPSDLAQDDDIKDLLQEPLKKKAALDLKMKT